MPTAWSSPHPLVVPIQCSLLYSFVPIKQTQCWSITLLHHHLQSSEMVFQSKRLKESWIVRFSMEGWSILCTGKGMPTVPALSTTARLHSLRHLLDTYRILQSLKPWQPLPDPGSFSKAYKSELPSPILTLSSTKVLRYIEI